MKKLRRRVEAQSLAENLAAHGSTCPIPFTHDRLAEAHHWWHEMAHNYHEPTPFRYALGAYIHAARGVTFMLQKEQSVFADFSWYHQWTEQAKQNPVLRWLADVRTEFVHRRALEPNSWLEMSCLGNPEHPHSTDNDALKSNVSPFECTHYYMQRGPLTDHAHEYVRHWEIDTLPGRELLEACADIYDQLDDLVSDAHQRLDAQVVSYRRAGSRRVLPCMEDTTKHRITRTSVRNGREVWKDGPPELHGH